MKKTSPFSHVLVPVLAATLAMVPVAALARDGEASDNSATLNATVQMDTGDSEGASAGSNTSIGGGEGEQNRNDNKATTTQHTQDREEVSSNSEQGANEADDEIRIDHESVASSSTEVSAPEGVATRGELRSFLNHIVNSDERIADVHVSSTTIETHYEVPAKFLWAIPTNLTAQVSVAADGSVEVHYPWYAFLFATKGEELQAQLAQAATSTMGAGATSFSASMQAHLLDRLFSILKDSTGN